LHPQSIPTNREPLTATANGTQERSNSPLALQHGAGVNRMLVGKGMVSKTNAHGKATG
jgi:hypothetical protein